MSAMPWVKLYVELLDDVKMVGLTDQQKWRFVQLILVAGECDAAGALVTGDSRMTPEMVAWRIRCDAESLKSDIDALVKAGLLILDDQVITVTKFAERQGPTQSEKRDKWNARQKRRRERVKSENVTQESPVTPKGVTIKEEEEEQDIKKIKAATAAPAQKDHDQTRKALEVHFLSRTGLPAPRVSTDKQKRSAGTLWWSPLREIAELSGWEADIGRDFIDCALKRLNGVTVSDPNSILKTVRAIYAERNGPGKGSSLEGLSYIGS